MGARSGRRLRLVASAQFTVEGNDHGGSIAPQLFLAGHLMIGHTHNQHCVISRR